jgi:hypothetical protein
MPKRKWSLQTRRRADRDHAAKKAARKQRQHLLAVKSEVELRRMVLASRAKQRKRHR